MRPKFIKGDRFRFRSDGEIGELNRSRQLNTDAFHTVVKVCKNDRIYHEGGGDYASVQCEICNDFTDIGIGDVVQLECSKESGSILPVMRVSDTHFSFNRSDVPCEYPKTGEWLQVEGVNVKIRPLRIVKKAPRPILADAQVCWICKHRNGAYSQIDGIDYPCPVTDCISIGKNRYDRDGKHSGEDMRLNPNSGLDIISTEPLATEGSAEWGKQRALLGNIVTLTHNEIYKIENGKLYEAFPNNDFDVWRLVAEDGVGYWDKWIKDQTGWQIYEPEPAPRLKVGDWVEMNICSNHQGKIKEIFEDGMGELYGTRIHRTNPTFTITGLSGEFAFASIARKLDPSEVKVKITLEGTVCSYGSDGKFFQMNKMPSGYTSIIAFSDLTPSDAELVRELVEQ